MSMYIQDWTVVSPIGVGKTEFSEAVTAIMDSAGGVQLKEEFIKPVIFKSFNKKRYLGKKGVRGMDALGAYATVASHLLLKGKEPFDESERAKVGVVLGTGTGSVKSQVNFIKELHLLERVEWVDPIRFPQTVMNCAAGQVSIWHRFTGVNTTVSSGYHSGVTAFEYAENVLQQSRVDCVFVGCAEEYSEYAKYQFQIGDRSLREMQTLGEGCAMFIVTREISNDSISEVFGYSRMAYLKRYAKEVQTDLLLKRIREVLKVCNLGSRQIRYICFNRFTDAEERFVKNMRNHLSEAANASLCCSNMFVAHCMSASSGMQIALMMALKTVSSDKNVIDLIVTFDQTGGIAISFIKHGV